MPSGNWIPRLAATFSFTLASAACGGSGSTPTPKAMGNAPAREAGAPQVFVLPTNLPPMASMPPPGVAGSKRVTIKDVSPCARSVALDGKSATSDLARLLQMCAKGRAVLFGSATTSWKQAATEAHQEHKLTVRAGSCLRVYIAHEGKELVSALRDADGAIAAESAEATVPALGSVCAAKDEALVLSVAAGAGPVTYAFAAVEE